MKKTSKSRKPKVKKNAAVLATCPIGSSGWCPYPFSVEQLQKRMKKIADQESKELVGSGASR